MRQNKAGKVKRNKGNAPQKRKTKPDYSYIISKFFKIAFPLVSIGVLGVIGYTFLSYLYTSPYFSVQEIIVNGEKRLTDMEVLNMARIDIGMNILTINLKEASKRIVQHPWIENAQLKRKLPQKIFIRITERDPIAIINLDRLYLIDKQGVIFKEIGPEDTFNLPVLTGLESADLAANESVSKHLIEKALTAMNEIGKGKALCIDELSEINMDPHSGLTLYTMKDATQIKLGFNDYSKKLDRLKKVIDDLQDRYKKADYIDLVYGEKVYVKLDRKELPRTLAALQKRKGR
ncbi:MAG: cell division protein FtsQ/DivIB [Thermodesulfobacteriota bacterium]|nr:cell division protein FtsQ/DivIB [Thermodesulfobacteriota bacterium]